MIISEIVCGAVRAPVHLAVTQSPPLRISPLAGDFKGLLVSFHVRFHEFPQTREQRRACFIWELMMRRVKSDLSRHMFETWTRMQLEGAHDENLPWEPNGRWSTENYGMSGNLRYTQLAHCLTQARLQLGLGPRKRPVLEISPVLDFPHEIIPGKPVWLTLGKPAAKGEQPPVLDVYY